VELSAPLTSEEAHTLIWLLAETYEPQRLTPSSSLASTACTVIEVGPRLNFSTAWSANAISICQSCGLSKVKRIEQSRRYALSVEQALSEDECSRFAALVRDRMTEEIYVQPLSSFKV
jgi:phosphoribosylformylglycinamidine synthase